MKSHSFAMLVRNISNSCKPTMLFHRLAMSTNDELLWTWKDETYCISEIEQLIKVYQGRLGLLFTIFHQPVYL